MVSSGGHSAVWFAARLLMEVTTSWVAHPHGSRVVAHLQPLCWGFFPSFEVTWSDVRPVLNVSFVFSGFTLWLRWKDLL